jgi:hypothetical protein
LAALRRFDFKAGAMRRLTRPDCFAFVLTM